MQKDSSQAITVTEQIIEDLRHNLSAIHIQASPQTVWEILTNYEKVSHHFPIITKSSTRSDNGEVKVLAQEVQPLPPFMPIQYVVEVRETSMTRLQWHGLTNYIKINRGSFSLEAVDGGRATYVVFTNCIEAPMLVPGALIRHQLKKIMPKILLTLKSHAEARDTKS